MLNILIIEDAQVNREFLLLALRPYGECIATGTGEQGLLLHSQALSQKRPFDVVFLDIQLPGIDGLKTLELLRAEETRQEVPELQRVQVIVTTVLNDHQTASRAFIQGRAASFLSKPFRLSQISEELENLGLLQI